ncbi:MAG: hypothetical protein ACOYNC_14900 [Bacteroidales bacterium]
MKKFMMTVLAFLGIQAFAKDKDGKIALTDDQLAKLKVSFGDDLTDKFVAALAKDPDGSAPDSASMEALITAMDTRLQTALAENATALQARQMAENDLLTANAEKDRLNGVVTEKEGIIATLTKKPEDDPQPSRTHMKTDPKNWVPTGKDTHLFGLNHAFLALDDAHGYNRRAYAAIAAFHGIDVLSPRAASSLDYASLKNDLGDFYRIRKQERIQSFLQELPSLTKFFNLESGYQDQAVLVNLFLGDDFSQADSTALGSSFDNVVKGSYKFEPEILTMYDVMFVHKFTQLKELEKGWIGYLNREGSSTMKWSFIEYILVETAKKLKNEQEQRRIRGVRKNPTVNVPGTAMQASNGVLKFLKNQIASFKIKPFILGEWTPSTIAAYIKGATQLIPEVLRDSGRIVLFMSTDALSDYHTNLETLYGVNMDYKADLMHVKEYPMVKIIAIPGMAPSKRMFWTIENNITLFEDQPGEMLNFSIEQQDWSLKVWSNWRESVWAYLIGKKYASAAEMPSDYSTQLIFCNDVDEPADFFINMEANNTTPSVTNHTSLVSVANTQATAITNILDAVTGQDIRLKCGNSSNAVTIAATGNFSLLTGAWAPAVGDILYLKKRSDGKFIEIKRDTVSSAAIALAANATAPDVSAGDKFITVANSGATALTTLTNAVTGKVYTLYGGSSTNATTIANAGSFALTAAMTLSAGTWIQLQKAANGTFYEINRG